MPAMPPTTAAPLLRTFRRVTIVMHSSSGDAFGRSDAGLKCLSDYRASIVQRMRTLSCAQHVVSTMICWSFRSSDVGGRFPRETGRMFAEQLLQPAHEPYRIPVP